MYNLLYIIIFMLLECVVLILNLLQHTCVSISTNAIVIFFFALGTAIEAASRVQKGSSQRWYPYPMLRAPLWTQKTPFNYD